MKRLPVRSPKIIRNMARAKPKANKNYTNNKGLASPTRSNKYTHLKTASWKKAKILKERF